MAREPFLSIPGVPREGVPIWLKTGTFYFAHTGTSHFAATLRAIFLDKSGLV